jgi:hypothetical protein
MDPFIEMQEWDDFHPNFITEIQAQLAPLLEPKYFVRVERRVYFERTVADDEDEPHPEAGTRQPEGPGTGSRQLRMPDVAVVKVEEEAALPQSASATAVLSKPEECVLPQGDERREYFLLIRGRESYEIVTVMELLSPTNKRPGSDGRELYLEKRQEILDGRSHLVELDLLRGGKRMPIHTSRTLGQSYYAVVSRRNRRPRATLYRWNLADPMPTISIPLANGDPDVSLNLQTAFANVYQRTRYNLSIDYDAPLAPPPTAEEEASLRGILAGRQ